MSNKKKPPRDDSQVQEIDLSSIDLASFSLSPENDESEGQVVVKKQSKTSRVMDDSIEDDS